jgi:hypothetical protein
METSACTLIPNDLLLRNSLSSGCHYGIHSVLEWKRTFCATQQSALPPTVITRSVLCDEVICLFIPCHYGIHSVLEWKERSVRRRYPSFLPLSFRNPLCFGVEESVLCDTTIHSSSHCHSAERSVRHNNPLFLPLSLRGAYFATK